MSTTTLLRRHLLSAMLLTMPFTVIADQMSATVPLELEKPAHAAPWQRYSAWKQTNWNNYCNLKQGVTNPVSFIQPVDLPIKGDPANGRKLMTNRKKGNCAACHIFPDVSLSGNVGLNISTVGNWGLPEELLFNYVYDARIYNPTTVMPPFGSNKILNKSEIMDIVSYLKTLTKPVKFDNPEDNPEKRPVPVETRDNLDEFENPGMFAVAVGEELYSQVGPKGKSCQDCHSEPEKTFSNWAVHMPKVEPRLNKVLGVEEFVTRHARATTGAEYLAQTEENLGFAVYLRYLANGQPISINTSDMNTRIALRRGEELVKRKIGQLNLACTDCHVISSNKWIRGQYLTTVVGMMDHFPTYRTSRTETWDIRKRFQWCNVSVRANDLPPDAPEYGDIELYLMVKNNGRMLSIPGIRH
ncbi:MAG: sulfur oxidation c-type cytochrome SoxA [Pseudomonadota bacterium]